MIIIWLGYWRYRHSKVSCWFHQEHIDDVNSNKNSFSINNALGYDLITNSNTQEVVTNNHETCLFLAVILLLHSNAVSQMQWFKMVKHCGDNWFINVASHLMIYDTSKRAAKLVDNPISLDSVYKWSTWDAVQR